MPLVGQLAEGVEDSAADPAGVILAVPHLRGYSVGGLEAYAPDVIGETVRVLLNLADALLAVFTVYLRCECGTHPVSLKEEHHVLDVLLLLPALAYLGNPLRTYPVDLVQTFYVRLDDIDGPGTEAVNDEPCELGTYTLDQTAPEVLLYAVGSGRHHLLPGRALELLPVLPVHPPFALAQQDRTRRDVQQVAHEGHEVVIPLDLHTEHRIAVFRVLVCDAFNYTTNLCHEGVIIIL